jgi:hypothetical protein
MTREEINDKIEALEDKHRSGTYFRIEPDGRVCIGDGYATVAYLKEVMDLLVLLPK